MGKACFIAIFLYKSNQDFYFRGASCPDHAEDMNLLNQKDRRMFRKKEENRRKQTYTEKLIVTALQKPDMEMLKSSPQYTGLKTSFKRMDPLK